MVMSGVTIGAKLGKVQRFRWNIFNKKLHRLQMIKIIFYVYNTYWTSFDFFVFWTPKWNSSSSMVIEVKIRCIGGYCRILLVKLISIREVIFLIPENLFSYRKYFSKLLANQTWENRNRFPHQIHPWCFSSENFHIYGPVLLVS